jgi:hypothetical protein
LPHERFCFDAPRLQDPCPSAADGREIRDEKQCSAVFRRNPLKNLDSDERIQGNPNFSNRVMGGFSSRNRDDQENPNRPTREGLRTDFVLVRSH